MRRFYNSTDAIRFGRAHRHDHRARAEVVFSMRAYQSQARALRGLSGPSETMKAEEVSASQQAGFCREALEAIDGAHDNVEQLKEKVQPKGEKHG